MGGTEVEQRIREILDNEIRPAVAMDGGDITLDRYENGIVYLHMQGSCAGCPSSTATLRMGIETRLREAMPRDPRGGGGLSLKRGRQGRREERPPRAAAANSRRRC